MGKAGVKYTSLIALALVFAFSGCGSSKDTIELTVNTGIPLRPKPPVNLKQNLMDLMSVTIGTDCYQNQLYLFAYDPVADVGIDFKPIKLRTNLSNTIGYSGNTTLTQSSDVASAINHLVNNSFIEEPLTITVPNNRQIEVGIMGTFFKPADVFGGADGNCDQVNNAGTAALNSTSMIGHRLVDSTALQSGSIDVSIDVLHTNPATAYTLTNPRHRDWVQVDAGFFSGGSFHNISVGQTHVCTTISGGVQCWGNNTAYQTGSPTGAGAITTPTPAMPSSTSVTAVSAGVDHTCVVQNSGAKCWGSNSSLQLGVSAPSTTNTPQAVTGLSSGVTGISAGNMHSCAVVSGGVQCWGSNANLQLGVATPASSFTPLTVTGLASLSGATAVSVSSYHSCAIISGGVKCWGSNQYGQLGGGIVNTNVYTPVQAIPASSGVQSLSAGYYHNCVIMNGNVRCWGQNSKGKLGNGTVIDSVAPVLVPFPFPVTSIAAGGNHTCAISGNQVYCWGGNAFSQLGFIADNLDHPAPLVVSGIMGAPLVVSANGDNTCVLTSIGMQCWGANSNGQVGNGSISTSVFSPATVTNLNIPNYNSAKLAKVSFLRINGSPDLINIRINPSSIPPKYYLPHIFPMTVEFEYSGYTSAGGCSAGTSCQGTYRQVLQDGYNGISLLNAVQFGISTGGVPPEIKPASPFIFNSY